MAKRNVMMLATAAAVTTVIDRDPNGGGMRYNIVTNPDEKADTAAIEGNPRATSAYRFPVSESVADQLEKAGVAKRDKGSKAAERDAAPTVEDTAREKLAEHAEADADASDAPSGASTRDTTAFASPPLKSGATAPAPAAAEDADADAPPAGDEGDEGDAPKRTRKASGSK
jgi:hypothetical protein